MNTRAILNSIDRRPTEMGISGVPRLSRFIDEELQNVTLVSPRDLPFYKELCTMRAENIKAFAVRERG
jgi:hypothetical protein